MDDMAEELKKPDETAPLDSRTLWISYILLIVLGGFGAHRIFHKRPLSGLAMLSLTVVSLVFSDHAASFGISAVLIAWMVMDAFLIPHWMRAENA